MSVLPNILWITTDHQRTDALGCYGSRWARSPNIDRLAKGGVRFSQCTCQSPSCTPSRSSFLTGKYVSTHGQSAYGRGDKLSSEVPLIRYFRNAGYQTAQLGKYEFLNNRTAFEVEFDICEHGPAPGAALGPFGKGIPQGLKQEDFGFLKVPVIGLVVGGINPLPADQTICALMAARAKEFLSYEAQEPFFLRLSINAPHMPFVPLPEFFGVTDREIINLPMPFPEELATKPQREIQRIRPFYNFHRLSSDQIKYCRGCFYDLCTELDSAIGQVLDYVAHNGFGENTLVVLHTDHATTLGEHGLGTIRTFYDPVIQVPFLWSWPGHLPEGATITDPVEAVDLVPTLLDLVGIDIPSDVEGRSLVPQIFGNTHDPHRPTFSEYDTSASPIGNADWIPKEVWWHPEHDRRVMIRQDGWKLECNYGDSEYGEDGALYHLDTDPFELMNLFNRAEYQIRINQLKQTVYRWFKRNNARL